MSDLRAGMKVRIWRQHELPDVIHESSYAPDHYICTDNTEAPGEILGNTYVLEKATNFLASGTGVVWALKGLPGVFISQNWVAEILVAPKCECGATAVGSRMHSHYCPKYNANQLYMKDET